MTTPPWCREKVMVYYYYYVIFCCQGFGAVCLQYAAYGLVLKFAHVIVREVSTLMQPPPPVQVTDALRALHVQLASK